MACCAFAVLIVSQIAVFLGGLRVLLPRRFHLDQSLPHVHAATAWKLYPTQEGVASLPSMRRRRGSPRRWLLAAGLAVELALGGAALVWIRGEHRPAVADPAWTSVWCSGTVVTATMDR